MDKTPKTELEIFLSKELETAQKELLKAKELLAEIQEGIETYINNIEVNLD